MVFSIASVFIYGSATAASVALGKSIGEDKVAIDSGKLSQSDSVAGIKKRSGTLQLIFLALGIIASILLITSKEYILRFYEISDEAKRLAGQFMTVLSVTVIGTAYQMPALSGIIRSGGDTGFVFYNDLIFMWGIVLPSSYIAAFVLKLSPVIVFICLKSDQILKCAVAAVKVNRYRWIRDI